MSKHYCRVGKIISNFEVDREIYEASKSLTKSNESSKDESIDEDL